MRIRELEEREDFAATLVRTLREGWTAQYGRPIKVSRERTGRGQPWVLNPVFSAFHTPDIGAAGRRFLIDGLRYTPRRLRAPLQWAVVTMAGTRVGLRTTGRFGFEVTPPVPGATEMVVVPGNQRVRVFDFAARVSRVHLKAGFDPGAMKVELDVRSSGDGPFPPVREVDPGGRWFVEPLLEGFSLPRCPPWRPARQYRRRAIASLSSWLDRTETRVEAAEHAGRVEAEIRQLTTVLDDHAVEQRMAAALPGLAARAGGAGVIPLAQTHGDFQPGNIFVETGRDQVYLIDWEFSGQRHRSYDGLVMALSARFPVGLANRLRSFIAVGPDPELAPLLAGAASLGAREQLVALFLLEEWRWHLQQNHVADYPRLTSGFRSFLNEVDAL